MKKRILAIALLLAVALLAGCSGGGTNEKKTTEATGGGTLQVVLANTYVPDEAATALSEDIQKALPDVKLAVSALSLGDTEADPMMAMAGMTKVAGMMASAEIELFICDPDSGRRYADGGGAYVAVDTLFTKDELAGMQATPVGVALIDGEGNETGETSAPCGLDLSGCERAVKLAGFTNPHAYVLSNAKNVDAAKQVLKYLAGK